MSYYNRYQAAAQSQRTNYVRRVLNQNITTSEAQAKAAAAARQAQTQKQK